MKIHSYKTEAESRAFNDGFQRGKELKTMDDYGRLKIHLETLLHVWEWQTGGSPEALFRASQMHECAGQLRRAIDTVEEYQK